MPVGLFLFVTGMMRVQASAEAVAAVGGASCFGAGFGCYCLTYILLFSVVLFGFRSKERPWVLGLTLAALAAFAPASTENARTTSFADFLIPDGCRFFRNGLVGSCDEVARISVSNRATDKMSMPSPEDLHLVNIPHSNGM